MTESSKIVFRHRHIRDIADLTDLVEILFPGNSNQQHAAARILLTLKTAEGLLPNLASLQREYSISCRTLQRTRAKLARLGAVEHVYEQDPASGPFPAGEVRVETSDPIGRRSISDPVRVEAGP